MQVKRALISTEVDYRKIRLLSYPCLAIGCAIENGINMTDLSFMIDCKRIKLELHGSEQKNAE